MWKRTLSSLGCLALLGTGALPGQVPDRDNRLDASGGWSSHIGVISILQ